MAFYSPAPDLVIVNGTVLTADADDHVAEAVAVSRGRIVAIGTTRDISALRGPSTLVVDLRGRTLIPGLVDPHLHLADDGTTMANSVDVRDLYHNISSVPDIVEHIRAEARVTPPGKWITSFGSPMQDYRMPERRFPLRDELDAVAPDNPVVITFGAHVTIANSKALDAAKITPETKPPEGGAIEIDPATGRPTGKLTERAQLLMRAAMSSEVITGFNAKTDYRHYKDGIKFASRQCLERGVTSIHDIVKTQVAIRAYQELAIEGALPLRTSLLIRVIEASLQRESLLDVGILTGFGNDWLRLGGVKMSIDGGITGRAAAFNDPYLIGHCDCGLIRIPQEELDETVDLYHRGGHRVCVHAIGDRAMDMALDAIEKALAASPRTGHRHRVEHLGNWMITPERLQRILKLGVLPVPNIAFMHYIFEPILECLGPERMVGAFGLKTMMQAGIKLTTGSDGPAYWPADPIRDMAVAVHRGTRAGGVVAEEEALSLAQALKMVTINAAYNGFEEGSKGSIETGKLADFAILADNPFTTSSDKIQAVPVDATILDGQIVFQRDGTELRA